MFTIFLACAYEINKDGENSNTIIHSCTSYKITSDIVIQIFYWHKFINNKWLRPIAYIIILIDMIE